MKAKSYVPSSGRMYLVEIASTCAFTSRAKSFSNCWRSMSLSARSIRSKLSSGNLESIGTIRSTLITASTRSPPAKPYWNSNAVAGSRSRSRFSSSSSPKPPRAFGGRRISCSSLRPFACSAICTVAWPTSPSCLWIAFVCLAACSMRRSTFVSSSPRRRSMVAVIASRRPSTERLRTARSSSSTRAVSAPLSPSWRLSQYASPPAAARTMSASATIMSRRTVETASDGTREGGSRRPPKAPFVAAGVLGGVRPLRVVLGRALALGLCVLLGAVCALRRHAFLLLVHAIAAHRLVAGQVAGSLLAATEQLVQETHSSLLRGLPGRCNRRGHKKRQIRKTLRPSGSDASDNNGVLRGSQGPRIPSPAGGQEDPHTSPAAQGPGAQAAQRSEGAAPLVGASRPLAGRPSARPRGDRGGRGRLLRLPRRQRQQRRGRAAGLEARRPTNGAGAVERGPRHAACPARRR